MNQIIQWLEIFLPCAFVICNFYNIKLTLIHTFFILVILYCNEQPKWSI